MTKEAQPDAEILMNADELRARFPNATEDFIRRNSTNCAEGVALSPDPAGKVAKLERSSRDGALGKVPNEARLGGRVLIRITSTRKRLLDEDNLCEKFLVDCCRHAGLIPDDSPGKTKIEVAQQKAEPGAAEEITVEVFKL